MEEKILYQVMNIVILTLLGIIGYMIKEKVKAIEQKNQSNEDEIKTVKENYLDRFEKVNEEISATREQVLEKISEIKIIIAERKK